MRKSGFTLIELLVVIAIIAILAAILFPVFAQAKLAAKAAASLSNLKQINTGAIMYGNDYDDVVPLAGTFGFCDKDAYLPSSDCTDPNANYATWALLMDPYTKNVDIYNSPLGSNSTLGGEIKRQTGTRFMSYGYNYAYLDPAPFNGTTIQQRPVSFTSIAQPADTLTFTEHVSRGNMNLGSSILQLGNLLQLGLAEAPDCINNTSVNCFAGWGNDEMYATSITSQAEGKFTGGNALRKGGNQTIVAMADGHVKNFTVGQLAAGTTYVFKDKVGVPSSTIKVVDASKYLWDTN